MKHLFFATLIIILTLLAPSYIAFLVCAVYLLSTGLPAFWIIVLGVIIDTVFSHQLHVFNFVLPLYTTLSVLTFFAIKTISKRLTFID